MRTHGGYLDWVRDIEKEGNVSGKERRKKIKERGRERKNEFKNKGRI